MGKEDFEKKVLGSLNQMEAKISYLHEAVSGLNESFHEFKEDITDYMAYSAERFTDHEKRIAALEKKSNS